MGGEVASPEPGSWHPGLVSQAGGKHEPIRPQKDVRGFGLLVATSALPVASRGRRGIIEQHFLLALWG
jgi:hypothetical protein